MTKKIPENFFFLNLVMIHRLSIKFFLIFFYLVFFFLKLCILLVFVIFDEKKTVPVGCTPSFIVSKNFKSELILYFWQISNTSLMKSSKFILLQLIEKWHGKCDLCSIFGPDIRSSFKMLPKNYCWCCSRIFILYF